MIKGSRKYEEALRRCNSKQREAIDTLHGPVLVIAGPGTGKTDVLTLRIGNILLSTDAGPSNILCLTYTEAGASEMRSRLLEYIGTEANRVRIQTFHGFCNNVIQDHFELMGRTREFRLVTEIEKIEILEEILNEIEEDSPLKRYRGDITYDRRPMKELFELIKQEGWTVEYVEEKINQWLVEAQTHEDFLYQSSRVKPKGSLKEREYNKEVENMERLRAGLSKMPVYIDKMTAMHRYDFADMLIWVHKAFNTHPDLLLDYQERFQYVLVDEFQDTNGIQLALLKQLTAYEQPNVFVVGDDDQAVYRFQGALVKNIAEYYYAYHPHVITLTENYRSSWHILRAAAAVIAHNRHSDELDGLSFSKDTEAAGIHAQESSVPRILEFPSRDQEQAWIAHELKELHESGVLERESVAVIYRMHKHSDNLVRILRYHDIPFSIARDMNMLNEPLVNNVLTIMEYVCEQYLNTYSGDDKLFEMMHYRHFGIVPRDIAKLAVACQRVMDGDKMIEPAKALRDLLAKKRRISGLGLSAPKRVYAFATAIEALCGHIHDETPPAFLERILHTTGLLRWVITHPDRDWYLLLLSSLMDHITGESERSGGITLAEYLKLIGRHRENNIDLTVKQVFVHTQGIEFITAHGAKGHEYDRVYILSCVKSDWESSRGGSYGTFSLPKNLVAVTKEGSIEDECRLFYVAMTRARKDLTITYSRNENSVPGLEPSVFVTELVSGDDTPEVQRHEVDPQRVSEFYTAVLDRKTEFPALIDHALTDRVLETYALSPTDMNLYMECPRSFYFEKILRIPSARQLYFVFGNVTHKSMERLFSEYWGTLFLNGETLLNLFEQEMYAYRGSFTRKEYEDTMIYGKEVLDQYQKLYAATWNEPDGVHTEYRVGDVTHRGVPIKGYIDKVEIRPTTVHLIDYKTGKYNGAKFFVAGREKSPMGGPYWRQMVFYKILLDHDASQQWNVVKGITDFVDVKRNKESSHQRREVIYNDQEVQAVSDQIVDVYERIRAHDFDHKCDRWNCKWCRLVESEFTQGAYMPEGEVD